MSSIYLEYSPSPRLNPFVASYWSLQVPEIKEPEKYRVLPDGCIDLIFDNISRPLGVIVGSMTKSVMVTLQPNARYFGVRFRPGGASSFLNISLKEIADTQIKSEDVWRNAYSEFSDVMDNKQVKRQIETVENLLEKQLSNNAIGNRKVQAAITLLNAHDGNYSVNMLSKTLEISRQHLNRIFTEAVGLNLKMFSRIVRLQAALKCARRAPVNDWALFALENGYYDQAHFISDFKDLTGVTPSNFFG
ncbi:MAG TPA: AraC family transcriptional regulator [Pyrinomonadaceae bacterium]|jgi:AraC-like DNA-binding protein